MILVAIFVSLLAAVIPTLIYAFLFYWADRYEREPRSLLMAAFFWGALPAIVVSLIAETVLGMPFSHGPSKLAQTLVEGVVIAPVIEETTKALVLLWIFYRKRQEFDDVLDGLIYGALVGFGFAMTENFFYFIGAFNEGGFAQLTLIIFLRAILFGLNHAFYTGLTGIGLGFARDGRARRFWMVMGLFAAIVAHSLHNLGAALVSVNVLSFALSFMVAGTGFGLVLLVVLLAWQNERARIQTELADEVGTLLTPEEFDLLVGRWRQPIRKRDKSKAERMQLYVELAERKHRLRLLGASREPELPQEIERIRTQLAGRAAG